jgi:hypothetical protein
MKRLIAFTLLLSLLLLLPACAAANQPVTDVDALEEQVNADWAKKQNVDEGTKVSSFRYYGTDNGYHIVMFNYGVTMGVVRNYTIAGYTFDNCATHFMAYKNGKFTKLNTAYLLRMVSKEAIAKAAELHEVVQAEKKEKNRIQSEFMNSHFVNIREFRFYGDENGRHILFVKTTKATIPLTVKQIAGSEFSHQGVFSLYAYIDGEFIDLEQAYKKGLISQEAIATAAKKHVEYETE